MRALVFAPLAILFCAVGLTVYYLSPPSEPAIYRPPISDAAAKARYGPDTPKGRKLIDRANEILAAIQEKCFEHRLQYVGPTRLLPEPIEFSSHSYVRENEIRTIVTFSTDDVNLEIVANTGTLVTYENIALHKQLENGPYFEPPEQPKLSGEEVKKLAADFLQVCAYDSNIRLSPPTTGFEYSGGKCQQRPG